MTGEKEITGLAEEICIWKDKSECGDCNLDERLFCHPKIKYMIYFSSPLLITITSAIIGMILSGFELLTIILMFAGWIVYALFFLNIWESRMVCNHCPYYANDSQRVLHCAIDKGKLKTSKYDPGPTSMSEKIQFLVGASILMFYPVPFLIVAGQFVALFFAILGVVSWIIVLQLKVCSDCINFACVLNRAPKSVRDAFFKRNPVIRKAWEEKGYKIE